jgi:hypothetical protein
VRALLSLRGCLPTSLEECKAVARALLSLRVVSTSGVETVDCNVRNVGEAFWLDRATTAPPSTRRGVLPAAAAGGFLLIVIIFLGQGGGVVVCTVATTVVELDFGRNIKSVLS